LPGQDEYRPKCPQTDENQENDSERVHVEGLPAPQAVETHHGGALLLQRLGALSAFVGYGIDDAATWLVDRLAYRHSLRVLDDWLHPDSGNPTGLWAAIWVPWCGLT